VELTLSDCIVLFSQRPTLEPVAHEAVEDSVDAGPFVAGGSLQLRLQLRVKPPAGELRFRHLAHAAHV
jgi:hypothetical protein